jgi:hypothetical protein
MSVGIGEVQVLHLDDAGFRRDLAITASLRSAWPPDQQAQSADPQVTALIMMRMDGHQLAFIAARQHRVVDPVTALVAAQKELARHVTGNARPPPHAPTGPQAGGAAERACLARSMRITSSVSTNR